MSGSECPANHTGLCAISTLGKVYSFQLPTVDDGMGGQSFEGFRSFLVRFPSAAVKPGLAWTDTTELKNSANGADLTTQVISTNKVVGDTTVNGEKAWKVQRTAAITTSGSGSQGGQAFVIEGKGTGTSTEYVSVKGVYLGSNGSQNADMTISVPGAGMTIPMTRVATTKVELVKK